LGRHPALARSLTPQQPEKIVSVLAHSSFNPRHMTASVQPWSRGAFQSGVWCCLALATSASAADQSELSPETVVMKQFIVEASRVDSHPWHYLAGRDFEVLSRSDLYETAKAAIGILNDIPLQQEILPPAYWAPLPLPLTQILFDRKPDDSLKGLLTPEPIHEGPVDEFNWGRLAGPIRGLTGGLTAFDSDTIRAGVNVWGDSHGPSDGARIGAFGLALRLRQCVPYLPRWYLAGVTGPFGVFNVQAKPTQLILPAALWISRAETDSLVQAALQAKSLPTLPPIAELFREPEMRNPSPAWAAEAGLFVRWGMFGTAAKEPSHRPAFDRLVERARVEPVTEAVFRECFGFGYAEMQLRLSQYLLKAVNEGVVLPYQFIANWPIRPSLKPRNATDAEVARLLGDWERMESDMIKVAHPALSSLFLEQAGKTLLASYAQGERDPRLLAAIGMYEQDAGSTDRARSFLEAATQAGVIRPAAYLKLAQLNFGDANANPSAPGGSFSAQQTAAVLKPLFSSRRQATLTGPAYMLVANTWARSVAKPTPGNLALVREGVHLYPRNLSLTLLAAKVHTQWGYDSDAAALIEQGLKFADAGTAEPFRVLQAKLRTTK